MGYVDADDQVVADPYRLVAGRVAGHRHHDDSLVTEDVVVSAAGVDAPPVECA